MTARGGIYFALALALGGAAVIAACDLQPQPLPPESTPVNSPAGGNFGDDGSESDNGPTPTGEPTSRDPDGGDAGDGGAPCDDAGDGGETIDAGDGGC